VESEKFLKPHKKRFESWHKRLKPNAEFLVDQVLERIVPKFIEQGYEWFDDFAGGNPQEIGMNEIPLQKRTGEEWPTVQIRFHASRPNLQLRFGRLPEICMKNFATTETPRLLASLVYAPAYFGLAKDQQNNDDLMFGYWRMALFPRKRILNEIDTLEGLLPLALHCLEHQLPADWLTASYGSISKNVWLIGSWHIDNLRRIENDKKA
jgi:hypothetical protein